MPRGPRQDAPGSIHHITLRGIERREIFRDDADRIDLLARFDRLIPEAGAQCLAWAFMPNHLHATIETGATSISQLMRRLLTGYAVYFNHRHDRAGHLFQNRFGSRLVEDDGDLANVVLYNDRNPLAAGMVASSGQLERYPWTGYGALIGARAPHAFESIARALRVFGENPAKARREIRRRMLQRDMTRVPAPERLRFARIASGQAAAKLDELVAHVCSRLAVPIDDALRGDRSRAAAAARAQIATCATRELGITQSAIASHFGMSEGALSRLMRRAATVR